MLSWQLEKEIGVPGGHQVARCVEAMKEAAGELGRRCPRTGPGKQNSDFPWQPAAPSEESKLFSWENAPFSMWRSSTHRVPGGEEAQGVQTAGSACLKPCGKPKNVERPLAPQASSATCDDLPWAARRTK